MDMGPFLQLLQQPDNALGVVLPDNVVQRFKPLPQFQVIYGGVLW